MAFVFHFKWLRLREKLEILSLSPPKAIIYYTQFFWWQWRPRTINKHINAKAFENMNFSREHCFIFILSFYTLWTDVKD